MLIGLNGSEYELLRTRQRILRSIKSGIFNWPIDYRLLEKDSGQRS